MAITFHIGILPDRPASEVADLVVAAEEMGFGGAWIADSQSIFRDGFAALTLAAARTSSIELATGVTNPITRHAAVLASSFATLDELSGGRAVLGIGVGESAVRTIGRRPARLAEMEEVALAVRDLVRGEHVTLDGTELHLPWSRREVPLYFAASGPRSLRLAGRVADGVLFQVGAEPELVRWALERVDEGVRDAGRKPGDVRRYARLASSIADDRTWALDQVRGYAAAAAGTAFGAIPAEVMPADLGDEIRRMKERYDYFEHASRSAGHAELVTERILDAISISGTAEEAIPRFRELVALGIDGFVVPITTADPVASMRALAEGVVPHAGAPA